MRLTKKEILEEQFDRWDLVIEDVHNFVANKIVVHNSNARFGNVLDTDESGKPIWTLCAGSHENRRKEFDARGIPSKFWMIFTQNMKDMLNEIIKTYDAGEDIFSAIVFGEMIGPGVQDMQYGLKEKTARVFDIAVNRRYMSYDAKKFFCLKFEVPMVPLLYRGPFSKKVLEDLVSGPTSFCDPNKVVGKFKGREGAVVTPVIERIDPIMIPTSTNGRIILKAVSADYLARKGGTDSH